ncbi:MAG TPA: endonuclease III [Blastocatellia bacterium]|nr:endonuclease III [Blastocatellia bacterium]
MMHSAQHSSLHESNELAERLSYIVQNLRAVYGVPANAHHGDPLDVLIGAILSQATSNANSDRTYDNLKSKFPTWEAVRRARVSSIESAIRLGGLAHQKSIRIKRLLNDIHERRGSLDLSFLRRISIEEARAFLVSLQGVGPITVACTLLFACNRPVFPVDTHILRIARRLGLLPEKCSDKQAHEIMNRMMGDLAPTGAGDSKRQQDRAAAARRYYETHINLIRHGREVCRPRDPLCEKCCLVDYCEYYSVLN